jgi:hypothetical protein
VTAYPAIGQPRLTAAGMRAAADLVETTATTGLHVTCAEDDISIQITPHAGTASHRVATLTRLATRLGSQPLQHDSRLSPQAWLYAHGQLAGVPVKIYTQLAVSTDGEMPLTVTADGRIRPWSREPLPAGTRWHTELDSTANAS